MQQEYNIARGGRGEKEFSSKVELCNPIAQICEEGQERHNSNAESRECPNERCSIILVPVHLDFRKSRFAHDGSIK